MHPPGNQVRRLIVDECLGTSTTFIERLQKALGLAQVPTCTFLARAHTGIPDAVILDRLLGPDTVLVTADRVLHNRACDLGFRSYFTDRVTGTFRRRKLPGIAAPTPTPLTPKTPLTSDYAHPANPIASALKNGFTERQFKRYRARRRRIRSYFGSEAQIASAAVTIGLRASRRGIICGYFLALSGNSGVKGIRASEGYALMRGRHLPSACCLLHALQEMYILQLENIATELFVIPTEALELCNQLLIPASVPPALPAAEAARTLLSGLRRVRALPCQKGRFFDAMESKLDQLERGHTNELVPTDFDRVIDNVLSLLPELILRQQRATTAPVDATEPRK